MKDFVYKEHLNNSAGYKRKDLPQINFEDISSVILELTDEGVFSDICFVLPKDLNFTQDEINESKIEDKLLDNSIQYKRRFFICSSDGFLIDGQHDLAYALEIDPERKLFCFKVNLKIDKLIERINKFKFIKNDK
jgi:hypothetical protein